METVLDRMKRIDSQGAVPGTSVAEPKQPDEREQAILDRHTSATPQVSVLQRAARIDAQREIDVRKQQRAYAEKAKSTDATTVDLTKEMLKNLNNRSMVLDIYRQMSPAQRQEVLNLAPGLAQEIGDDRGGIPMRAFNAVTSGISDVAQPIMELAGQVTGTDWGGTPEEIEFIRQLQGAASQEFAPARPGDPWYQKGPLQALQMTPWMATTIGGGIGGGAAAKAGGQVLARGASAGVPGAKAVFQGVGAVGKIPKIVGLKGATTKATMEGLGTVAGITAAGFPSQYAQEVDSLKELGMEDNLTMRLLAGGTAAVASALESVIPNPLKAGPVPLTQGAVKAARQYLWNAAKQAPGEMSEEYLQGVTSGLGQWVAQYLDENAEDKSIADAFQTGYEQAKEAALPMAFLLGVPAIGGAANAGRLARLQAIRAKGFISEEDAKKAGIEGKSRKERLANADKKIEELKQVLASAPAKGQASPDLPSTPPPLPATSPATPAAKRAPWYDFGSGEPEGDIPPPPGLGLLDRLTGRAPQGTPPRLPGAPGATGATGAALPEPSWQPTRLPGSSSAAQNPELPVEAESQADSPQQEVDSFAEYADAWSEQSAKRRGVEKKPLTQSMLDTLRTTIDNHADAAIQKGRSSKFATDNTAFDELEMREIQNAVRRKGYEVGEVQRSSEGGVDYIGFDVTGKRTGQPPSQASENTAPAPQQPKGGGSTTTAGQVPPITSQSPSASGLSEGTGTKPATGSPTVSPDAPATPETSKGKAEGEGQSSEDSAGKSKQPPRVYREMAADELDMIINPSTSSGETFGGNERFWSDNPDLAIGQGSNKGFVVELDPSGLDLKEHAKPATAIPGVGKEFTTRHRAGEFRPGVRSITVKPGQSTSSAIRVKRFLEGEVKAGRWTKSKTDSGGARYSPVAEAESEDLSSETGPTGQPRRGEVGGKLAAGEVVTTSSGRQTTPFPKIDVGTDRKTGSTLKRVDKWLYDNAVEEARARGDDFNLRQFEAEDPAKMPPASKDAMEEYLFGQQPDVVPPIAKPIDTPATSDKPKQGPQPPPGYKPRAEFTPAVTQIKSPDLELRDNIADMKQLKLKLGDAVGYRVYPDPKSTKGGYWEYGTVVSVVGSHAGVKRSDGQVERVGGSRLHRLEPVETSDNTNNRSGALEKLEAAGIKIKKTAKGWSVTGIPTNVSKEIQDGIQFEGGRKTVSGYFFTEEPTERLVPTAEAIQAEVRRSDAAAEEGMVSTPIGILSREDADWYYREKAQRLEYAKQLLAERTAALNELISNFVPAPKRGVFKIALKRAAKTGDQDAILRFDEMLDYSVNHPELGLPQDERNLFEALQETVVTERDLEQQIDDELAQQIASEDGDTSFEFGDQDSGKPKQTAIEGLEDDVARQERKEKYDAQREKAQSEPDEKLKQKTFLTDIYGDPSQGTLFDTDGLPETTEADFDAEMEKLMAGLAKPESGLAKPSAKLPRPKLSDDDVADRLFDIQDGDSLDLPLWRAGEVNDTQGAFYSPRSERSLRYGRKADRVRVKLKSVLVAETKEDAAKTLGVQAEFYDAQDNTDADQDPDTLSDIVLKEAAQNSGYDGIVFRMDGMGSPEVYAFPASKPKKTGKRPKTAEEKSADDRARAAAKKEEAKRKMREAFEGTQGRPLSGFDPEIGIKVAQAVKLYIEAEALDFRAFIRELVSDFGRVWVEDKAPYFESAWRTANKLKWVDSPVGKVADVLTEIGDYGTLVSPNRVELGKHFQQQLESGKAYKSIVEARKEAATLIAGEDANIEPGTPAAKAIDEAVEQGVVRAARSIAESSADPLEVYDSLLDLYNRHPRLNVRTGTSMREQAYSTPAPVAWIANILSDTSRENTAYDSSAGNGMLLLGVDPENAIANELNPERAQSLRELGYDVHEGDATDYTPEQQPERIIINPPFGQLEGKTWTIDGTTTDKIDHAIVLKTLKSLPEDGKAVLIIGSKGFEKRQAKDELRRGEAYKNDKNFYNALYDGYNVTDHFTLHGDMYSKQGAAFPIDVIVIDGRGKSTLPKPYQIDHQNAIPRVINNYQELRDVGARYLDTGTGRPSYLSTKQVKDEMGGLSSLLEGQGKGDVQQGGRPGKDAGGSGSIPSRGGSQSQQPRGDSGQPGVPVASKEQGTGKSERLPRDDQSSSPARSSKRDDAGGLDRVADVDDQETGFQTAYKQRSGSRNVGTLVPTTHVRAVQDALDKAEDRYGNLDEFVAGELGYSIPELEKYFSAEQVDALALTIARHKEGKAFVLGDQCVSGDTLILDPTTGRQQKIRDLADANEEITVLSLTDQGLAPARASAPFFKGVSPLYRVTLDDGKEIDVTPHHRFLTQSGWSCLSDGIQIGDALAVAHESRANSQTTHASCEQTGFQTPQDCLGHYSTYHRLRGEQPLLERDSDQGRTPQQVYVDAHIRSLQREDGQASKRECNQVVPASTLHSKSNWMSLESHDLGVTLAQPLSCDVRLQRQNIGNVQQSDQSSCLLTQELPEVHPLERYADDRGLMVVSEYLPSTDGIEQTILHNHVSLQSQDQTNQTCSLEQSPQLTVAVWASVVSIEYQGVDDFYDMHVPVHCNYVGGGFVNHNTGVGKGRVAAATMVYAKRQGLVPVFVTQSSDLYADMYRDLQDIGQHSEGEPFYALATNTLMGKDKIELPDGTIMQQSSSFSKDTFNEVAASVVHGDGPVAMIVVEKTTDAKGKPLGQTAKGRQRVRKAKERREYDAVFTAYSQMQTVAGETKDRHTAMSLIAPNAFFVLDESHNAGGVTATDGEEGPVGRAARLRNLISEAQGVLFLSATYAKNPGVMDLYSKTGMGDAIQGADQDLIETIIKGGIPLQQVLSEMLVESGTYMRREKSFEGIEFGAKVEQTGEAEADEVAGIFNAINELDKIKNEIVKSKAFKRWLTAQGLGLGKDSATGKRGLDSSQFSSIVHNLVDQMLLSIKADAVADEAIATLRRGESPMIALSNTAGAALDNYLENFPAEVGGDIEFGFNTTASRYLERSREIMLTDVDASGKRTSRRVRLPDEVLGEDGLAAYNAAKELIDGFASSIPASPIDHIRNRIEQAGYTVAEITGRDMMVDYSGKQMRLARRPPDEQGKSGKLSSVRKYNAGEIDVLILNQSGSTGLSAHASSKFANQKRRHMIIAQADRNIDTFMQMLGRINRTGQVEQHEGQKKGSNLPHYTLLMTNVPAEIRPASVLMKKLASLNANVTADSQGSVSFDAPDILNKVGDRVVAEYIADNPALNHALGDVVDINAEGSPRVVPDIARKVSGRMAMRPIPEQKAFWDSVTGTYAEEIEQLNKLGKNPLAATKLDLGARTLERVEIFAGDPTADSPFLQPAYADMARVKKQGEPMTPEEVRSTVDEFYGIRTKRKRGPDPFGDMESELHREAITGESVEQNVQEVTDDLGQEIRKWSVRQAELAAEAIKSKAEQQVSKLINPEAIARVLSRAEAAQSTIRRRLNSVAPGMVVEVSEVQDEGNYSDAVVGIVIDVKAKKGNEHLPSGWIATIALSSPDRVVRVPFSRIETSGNSQPGDVYVAPSFEIADDQIYSQWEEIGDAYEERIIGTGNVLAAFDQLVSDANRGSIIFFTDEQGVSQRGVLMPRSFNLDRWSEKRPVTFTTPQHVLDFISIDPGHQANDPNFAIQFTMDGTTMNVRSPRSRQRSGRYTTNQELIEASGTDFASVGQILQMKVSGKKQQLAVIEAAQKLGPLIAANYKEDARAIVGVPGTERKKAPAGDGGSSLDAFTSPELQNRQSMGAARRQIASAADLVGDDDGGSSSRYASPDKEFERRWQMATRGISKKTLATKLREFWRELVKSTVRGSLPELPRTEQFGEARSAMHAYQNAPTYAQLATADLLKKTSKPLSASDYDLFTRVVIMRDQVEAASKGERLSYGLTPEKAQAELARVEALAENNERVQASLEYRRQWTEAMVDDFLSAHEYLGLDMSDRFKRENYFRHQVLYYMEAQQRGLGKKKVELTPNRGWLKGRTSGDDLGEAFDINANYLQAEWEVSTQMIADTKRAQAIGRLKRHYDKMRQLKEKAKYDNYVAVVGGLENMQEIEELRGLMAELRESGSLDSGEKAQLKEWSERLWELDPTMPFRQRMAIARDQIERGAAGLGEDASDDFMRYVSSLAKRDDSPLQPPALEFLKAVSDRKKFIKNALGDKYETWEDVVPDDHEEVAIRPGRAMFQAYSVPEQIASELMAGLSKTLGISAEDLRPLTALGSKYTPLVVPQEVAAQMAAIDNKMDFGWLDHMVTRPMNAWKRWVLMSPTRVFKYNLRNLSEVDKVMALNPAALKDIPQAIRDLWKLYSGADDIPATVRDWVERGGSGTLVRVNELGELNELKQFAKLIADKRSGVVGKVIKAPASAWKAYWSAAGISSDFRESILRYAAYLNYLKQLDAGKLTNYGGSVRAEVDGIKDNKDKAMRLSADLLGDYGDISLVGQFLRSRFAPFWSFQETNLRTYFRGLVNLASNEQSAIKAGMQIARAAGIGGLAKTPFLAYKLGRIAILFYGLKAMTTAFNQLLFGDDDDELSEEEKRKAHLTFGKNSKGEVQYFSRIGTAADVLDWVGLDSVDYDLRDVLDGRRTLKEVLNDMARSPVDKAYGMLSPFIKVPTELAVGQTAYPSVGKPRPIRDRGRYIAQNMGLSKEYDKLTGKPSTPYSVTDLFLYKVEPGTSDYYLTLDAKFRWLKTARNRGVGYSDSSRGNALRNYKMAVRLKDQTAADKYLAEYEADKGTKEGLLDSLEWSHPAGGLSTIDAYLFYKSLAPVEQAEYRDAERFYYSELLTEEQAKTIRARRDKRLRDLAVGKNKDGSPKGKPVRQRGEAFTQYRERLSKWQDEREIAREALQEFK